MEDDLNDEELEERFYSMLHHVDDSKTDVTPSENALNVIKDAPQSTLRRYWRTNNSRPAPTHYNSPFQKINTPKEPPKLVKNYPKPKTEKCPIPAASLPQYLSIFQTTSPHNVKKTIEIIEHDHDKAVEIVTSDDDEVIEVALPPKPTITIDSSDDELVAHVTPTKTKAVPEKGTQSREVSSSPVPSIVSSVSDDFIRGDCVAFNISRRPEKNRFDFSLHGADLGVGAPPKKKKKKKNKENATTATSTPISADTTPSKPAGADECFATPKSKAKNKKSKTKLYTVTETSIPSADVYDSDSNQSTVDVHNKNQSTNVAEEINLPPISLFENESVVAQTTSINQSKSIHNSDVDSSDSSTSLSKDNQSSTRKEMFQENESIIDLTENVASDNSIEDIVMANVVGFKNPDDLYDQYGNNMNASLGSTRVPDILLDNNHDFDNMKSADRPSRKRRYSMTTIRNDMQTFYNDSWGGEQFNHREIQKNMSRDKSLWVIDMQDKMPMHKKRYSIICNYCHRPGHRDVSCWQRPPVCHMCGTTGHREPRCPFKICVNCGTPNSAFSERCGACAGWSRCVCAQCRQRGHPASHCAVLWRRHHHTIYDPSRPTPPHIKKKTPSNNGEEQAVSSAGGGAQPQDAQVSKRKHPSLYSTDRYSKTPAKQDQRKPPESETVNDRNGSNNEVSDVTHKSQSNINKNRNISVSEGSQVSKTPIQEEQRQPHLNQGPLDKNIEKFGEGDSAGSVEKPYEIVVCKKRNLSASDHTPNTAKSLKTSRQERRQSANEGPADISGADYTQQTQRSSKAPARQEQRKRTRSEDPSEDVSAKRVAPAPDTKRNESESAAAAAPAAAADQAPDFIPISNNLDAQGRVIQDNNVTASNTADDCDTAPDNCAEYPPASHNIPYSKYKAIRKLSKALGSLNEDIGEPNALHKELNYLQNKHKQLLNQKQISPEKLKNSRRNIEDIAHKLNLVLVGQAGFGGGSGHVQELNSLKEKLVNLRQKNVPDDMRFAIGEHYNPIFSSMPRDDYWDLLNSYNDKHRPKRNPNKDFMKNMKTKKKLQKQQRNLQNMQQNKDINFCKEVNHVEKILGGVNTSTPERGKQGKNISRMILGQLKKCWRQLVSAGGARGKGGRAGESARLARQLHAHIVSLSNNANISAKNFKKIIKIQQQAELLLKNRNRNRTIL